MKLEDEVYESLKEHFSDYYDIRRKSRLEGYSGFAWEPDFVMEKYGEIVAIIEVKEVSPESDQRTLHTHMRLAFAELCDLHRKYSGAITLVIIPRETLDMYEVFFEGKYYKLFSSINGGVFPKEFIEDPDGLLDWLKREGKL